MKHLKKALVLLLLPCAELVFLRLYLHYALRLQIGWFNMTDYDLAVPGLFAFFVLVFVLEKEKPQQPKLQKTILMANLFLFVLFILGNNFLRGALYDYSLIVVLFWWVGLFLITATAFFSFVPHTYFFSRLAIPITGTASLLAFSVVLNSTLLRWLWPAMLRPIGVGTRFLSEFFIGESVTLHPSETSVILMDPRFAIKINQACGGGDALLLFVFCFSLFCMLYGKFYSTMQKFFFGMAGCLTMFGLNIVRISILFWVGSYFGSDEIPFGQTAEYKLFFHTHVGWVLYFGALIILFRTFLAMALNVNETRRHSSTLQPSTV